MGQGDRWTMGSNIPVEIYSILVLVNTLRLGISVERLEERGQRMQAMRMKCPTHGMQLSFAFAVLTTTAWNVCSVVQQSHAYYPFVAKRKMLKWFNSSNVLSCFSLSTRIFNNHLPYLGPQSDHRFHFVATPIQCKLATKRALVRAPMSV